MDPLQGIINTQEEFRQRINNLEVKEAPRWIMLMTPLTSTLWDGDAYSTIAKTLIDLSVVFGVPAGVKAVLVHLLARDSGSAAGTNILINLGPTNTASVSPLWLTIDGVPNDHYHAMDGIVPCDANGDIYYEIGASGASTMDVYLQIWGYLL